MIDIKDTYTDCIICHRFSADSSNNISTSSLSDISKQDFDSEALKEILLKPFITENKIYEFIHEFDITLNTLRKLTLGIYDKEDFIVKSKEIFQHLNSVSKHPNIKDGDLFIVKFADVLYKEKYYEAVGIYKIETKDKFIEVTSHEKNNINVEIKQGIISNKIDKASLTIFTETEPTILVIDKHNNDTQYWIDDFLHVRQRKDEYYNTQNVLSLCKNFVTKELPQQFEVSKADQANLLNKSVKFFKEKETFNIDEFTNEVITQPEVINSFYSYKSEYQKDHDVEIADSFAISDNAVKKQSRILKSVIKLDKNFHIYVHGNNQYIKKGYDEETGLYYYQLFFKEEL